MYEEELVYYATLTNLRLVAPLKAAAVSANSTKKVD